MNNLDRITEYMKTLLGDKLGTKYMDLLAEFNKSDMSYVEEMDWEEVAEILDKDIRSHLKIIKDTPLARKMYKDDFRLREDGMLIIGLSAEEWIDE